MKNKELKKLLTESKNRSKIYGELIKESEKSFRELNSVNMQGTLIQIEDFFDSNHLYAYKNWIDGCLYDGPNIKRYWVELTLKYPYKQMPDPKGGIRLSNMDVKINFKESTEWVPVKVNGPDDLDPQTRKPKEEERKIWLVKLRIPRRFIEDTIEDEPENIVKSSTVDDKESKDVKSDEENDMELDIGDTEEKEL